MQTNPLIASTRLARSSMMFAGLMWLLPFLYSHHVFPLPGFYQEWSAALLGLLAMPLLVTRRFWQRPEIPRVVLLPIGLSLLVLVQFAMGKMVYLDQALMFTLYMLWAAFLIVLGYRLREELGLPALTTVLAACLLLGAELNALLGLFQQYFLCTHLDYSFLGGLNLGGLSGSLGQRNHFANYITLGLVSLGLLHLRWKVRWWQMALLAAPLLLVLTLSGSRSPWLYLLCMTGMAFLWQRRDKSCLPLLNYSLALLLGFGLMHFVVQIPWLAGCSSGLTSWERLITEGGLGGSIRFYLWHEAWMIFAQFPLLGAGFGQFAWQHFQLGPALYNADITGRWDNAHNLVLQVAAEMGLAGLLVLLGTLALWFLQARTVQRTIYHWWGYGLFAVLAIHSLLEYPLWYAYFLGVAALALGVFDTTVYRLKPCGFGRWSVAAMLLLGLLSLSQMLYLYNYNDFETATGTLNSVMSDNHDQRIRTQRVHDRMLTIQRHALLLRPYVEIVLGGTGWNHIADKGALNERVMHYMPSSPVVYREALLLARFNQQSEARALIERAIWAYPGDFSEHRDKLRILASGDADPSRYPALLEFSLQKYEERQRAANVGRAQ